MSPSPTPGDSDSSYKDHTMEKQGLLEGKAPQVFHPGKWMRDASRYISYDENEDTDEFDNDGSEKSKLVAKAKAQSKRKRKGRGRRKNEEEESKQKGDVDNDPDYDPHGRKRNPKKRKGVTKKEDHGRTSSSGIRKSDTAMMADKETSQLADWSSGGSRMERAELPAPDEDEESEDGDARQLASYRQDSSSRRPANKSSASENNSLSQQQLDATVRSPVALQSTDNLEPEHDESQGFTTDDLPLSTLPSVNESQDDTFCYGLSGCFGDTGNMDLRTPGILSTAHHMPLTTWAGPVLRRVSVSPQHSYFNSHEPSVMDPENAPFSEVSESKFNSYPPLYMDPGSENPEVSVPTFNCYPPLFMESVSEPDPEVRESTANHHQPSFMDSGSGPGLEVSGSSITPSRSSSTDIGGEAQPQTPESMVNYNQPSLIDSESGSKPEIPGSTMIHSQPPVMDARSVSHSEVPGSICNDHNPSFIDPTVIGSTSINHPPSPTDSGSTNSDISLSDPLQSTYPNKITRINIKFRGSTPIDHSPTPTDSDSTVSDIPLSQISQSTNPISVYSTFYYGPSGRFMRKCGDPGPRTLASKPVNVQHISAPAPNQISWSDSLPMNDHYELPLDPDAWYMNPQNRKQPVPSSIPPSRRVTFADSPTIFLIPSHHSSPESQKTPLVGPKKQEQSKTRDLVFVHYRPSASPESEPEQLNSMEGQPNMSEIQFVHHQPSHEPDTLSPIQMEDSDQDELLEVEFIYYRPSPDSDEETYSSTIGSFSDRYLFDDALHGAETAKTSGNAEWLKDSELTFIHYRPSESPESEIFPQMEGLSGQHSLSEQFAGEEITTAPVKGEKNKLEVTFIHYQPSPEPETLCPTGMEDEDELPEAEFIYYRPTPDSDSGASSPVMEMFSDHLSCKELPGADIETDQGGVGQSRLKKPELTFIHYRPSQSPEPESFPPTEGLSAQHSLSERLAGAEIITDSADGEKNNLKEPGLAFVHYQPSSGTDALSGIGIENDADELPEVEFIYYRPLPESGPEPET